MALEAVEVGFGGAGRNVGYVNAGMWVLPSELPKALGADYGERALKLLGDCPAIVWETIEKHAIACDPVRNGTLHCAVGAAGLKNLEERARQWGARGAPVRVLSPEETQRRTGAVGYAGSLLDMRAGTIQPLAYARGLASAAIARRRDDPHAEPRARDRALGRHVDAQDRARRRQGRLDRRRNRRLRRGRALARRVAAGADPPALFQSRDRAAQRRSNARKLLPGREGCWDTKDIMSYFRLDRDGRLLFGSVGALNGTGFAVHRAWAERAMKKLFPWLGRMPFEHHWYGMIGMTTNYLPRFHRLADRVVSFSGYNGRGIGPGTVFGRTIADHILGRVAEKDLPLPLTAPEQRSLPALREAYYATGAQIAHAAGGWV